MPKLDQLYTTQQAAALVGLTDGRIRQLCGQMELGRMFGTTRMLTPADLRRIRNRPGKRKKYRSRS